MTVRPAESLIEKLISSSELIVTEARPGESESNVIPAPPLATVSASLVIALVNLMLDVPEAPVPNLE